MTANRDSTDRFSLHATLDLEILNQLAEDTSNDAAQAIMGVFLSEIDRLNAEIETTSSQSYSESSLASLSEAAHRCKSSAGYCGAVKLQQFSEQLERTCSGRDAREAQILVESHTDILNDTQKSITDYLDKCGA